MTKNTRMPKRCHYRITEEDVNELRERTHGQVSFDAHSNWVNRVAELDPLIHEITEAFHGVTLGDGIGLLEANGIDDYASPSELAELRSRDEKSDWKKIDTERLNHCYVAPGYFDARGFWFHLPAFLISDLNDDHNVGFIDQLISHLQIPSGWVELLTKTQRAVIAKTLTLFAEHPSFMHLSAEIDVAIQRLNNPPGK